MSAWKEPAKKPMLLVKDSKKTGGAKYVGMIHKQSEIKNCGYENTWSGQHTQTIKIKQPEGNYEFKVAVTFKTGQKVKGGKKKPIPPTCKIDSAWEFTEVRIFVTGLKVPTVGTCEADIKFKNFKNTGSAKDFDPWIMFDLDIRTGLPVMGTKWNNHLYVCDVFAGKQKVKIN